MIKATTSHGTHYLIDEKNHKAIRVPAQGRMNLDVENDWFYYTSKMGPEIGNQLYFNLWRHPKYDWIMSTPVTAIEEVDNE